MPGMRPIPTAFGLLVFGLLLSGTARADAQSPDAANDRDILVTFDNRGARVSSAGAGPPYQNRKRYAVSAKVRWMARRIAADYSLEEIDEWPIRSLGIYCSVFRIPAGGDPEAIITRLRQDSRVESAQRLQAFETGTTAAERYDDTYAGLQHVLDELDIASAHRYATGAGVRVAIVDSNVDARHEDLVGRLGRVSRFERPDAKIESSHGTAVASIIGARANNARGMVGIAPDAMIDAYVACWSRERGQGAVCDSFTLLKALDAALEDPPDILNLSLNGPQDPLVSRLLLKAHELGVVIVAAKPNDTGSAHDFPASMGEVIAVGVRRDADDDNDDYDDHDNNEPRSRAAILAPGEQILVAIPSNDYEFRSGTSLAAAHVSGMTALLLSLAPETESGRVTELLEQTQRAGRIDACSLLQMQRTDLECRALVGQPQGDPSE
ncbi:MAG: S8 family serine peptidase [Pseudomonadota bacterium]